MRDDAADGRKIAQQPVRLRGEVRALTTGRARERRRRQMADAAEDWGR